MFEMHGWICEVDAERDIFIQKYNLQEFNNYWEEVK
jgi:hypothetical protein